MSASAASADFLEPIGGVGNPTPVHTVSPVSTAPSAAGQWEVLPYNVPGLAIHATVMNNGRVLIVEGSGNDPEQFAAGTFNVWVWDAQARSFTKVPQLPFDLWCSGHAVLPNGRVLFAGGTKRYPTPTEEYFLGTKTTYEFDPATRKFTRRPDMASGRWYPSVLEQANGSLLAVSGTDDVDATLVPGYEIYNPSTKSWTRPPRDIVFPFYPALTLLQDGQVFYSGAAAWDSHWHDPGVWDPPTDYFTPAPMLNNFWKRNQAASVLLPPAQSQRIAVFGGGDSSGAVADTDVYDVSNSSAPTRSGGVSLATPKMHVLGVILPDETVFETGGSWKFAADPVQEAAIYQPTSGLWAQMNPPTVPRTYHSEAVLLPDGRVATLGSNPLGAEPEVRIELFSPPYLFKGQRPTITSAPTSVAYGSSYSVTVGDLALGATLSKLVLIKQASVTHSTDPNQRLVELPFSGGGGSYNATIPANRNLTPPGWYMLFAVDSVGRPSTARWVKVA